MPRLPAPLEPAFPLVKKGHLMATRRVGAVTRAAARRHPGGRSVPHLGTMNSLETAALEPDAVTVHPAGPGEVLHRTMPVGSPPEHWFFRDYLELEVPARFTLEIENGTVIGNYAANITPGGVLDFETSPYYAARTWREHPVFLRPRLPEARHVPGSLLSLATRGTAGNYYHVLLDMVPKWAAFRESLPDTEPTTLYANRNSSAARQLLDMLGLADYPYIEPGKHVTLRADQLFAPSIPNAENPIPLWTTNWLRENLPPQRLEGRPRRLYVTRGSKKNTRRVVNEPELDEALRRRGFVKFDPGAHSIQEQIDHFAAAEVVTGPHGAGLTNLVFSRPGVRVLELFARRYMNPAYWAIVSNISESTYRYQIGGPPDRRPPGSGMLRVLEDITVDPDAFTAALDDLL